MEEEDDDEGEEERKGEIRVWTESDFGIDGREDRGVFPQKMVTYLQKQEFPI